MKPDREPVEVLQSLLHRSHMRAYARFGPDGSLKEANPRFLHLVGSESRDRRLPLLVIEGQREEVARLLRDREPPGAPRNLHFAAGLEAPTTLVVSWDWWLKSFRSGHDLPFEGKAVRRCFAEIPAEVGSRLEEQQFAAEYSAYRAEVERLIADAFPEP